MNCLRGSKSRSHRRSPDHWLDYARPKYDEHLIAGVKSMLAIIVLYIPIVFFWALYDQQVGKAVLTLFMTLSHGFSPKILHSFGFSFHFHGFSPQGSTWVLQARRMDGRIGWFTLLPDQVNTLNPLLVLILVPLFEAWLYPSQLN